MEEDDELAGWSAGARGKARPGEFCSHHYSRGSGLYRDRITLFNGPVVRPEETGRHAAPGPPRLRKQADLLRGRPLRQPKSQPRAFLKGKIAGRPGIRMSEAKQEVDIGRPRADAVDGAERLVRIIGSHLRQSLAIKHPAGDGAGTLLEGPASRPRHAKPGESVLSGPYAACS